MFQAAINTDCIPPELILSTSTAEDVLGLLDLLRRAAAGMEGCELSLPAALVPTGELTIALQYGDCSPTIRFAHQGTLTRCDWFANRNFWENCAGWVEGLTAHGGPGHTYLDMPGFVIEIRYREGELVP